MSGELSEGHARALMSLSSENDQNKLLSLIQKNALSVRQTEEWVKRIKNPITSKSIKPVSRLSPNLLSIEEKLKRKLETPVRIFHSKNKGKIVIPYNSNDELDRLLSQIL